MKKAVFWTKDWFLGRAVAIVLFLLAGSNLVQSFERRTYDIGVRAAERAPCDDRIALIVIDDAASKSTRASER